MNLFQVNDLCYCTVWQYCLNPALFVRCNLQHCQTSNMGLFANVANSFQLLIIFEKSYILQVWQVSKYASSKTLLYLLWILNFIQTKMIYTKQKEISKSKIISFCYSSRRVHSKTTNEWHMSTHWCYMSTYKSSI